MKYRSTYLMDVLIERKDVNFPQKIKKLIDEKGPVKTSLVDLYCLASDIENRCTLFPLLPVATRDEMYANLLVHAMSVLPNYMQEAVDKFRCALYEHRWNFNKSRTREMIILDYATAITSILKHFI